MGRSIAAFLTALCIAAGAMSCAPVPRTNVDALLETPLGDRLESLWARHGGIDAWQRFAGVRFRLTVESGGGAVVEVPAVVIVYDEPGRVWVSTDSAAELPQPAALRPVSLATRFAPESEGATTRRELAAELGVATADLLPYRRGEGRLDYSLRSLRSLFHLPFFVAGRGWRLRSTLGAGAGAGEADRQFEALPWREEFLLGAFLFPPDDEEGDLDRLLYLSAHPLGAHGVREVRFAGYRDIDGIRVSTVRDHLARREVDTSPGDQDPFLPSTASRRETVVFLRERLDDITFLTTDDVHVLLGRGSVDDPAADLAADPADDDRNDDNDEFDTATDDSAHLGQRSR